MGLEERKKNEREGGYAGRKGKQEGKVRCRVKCDDRQEGWGGAGMTRKERF